MSKHRGGMVATIGDKEYKLFPTFESIMDFEERSGVEAVELCQRLRDKQSISFRVVTSAIWSGVRGYYDSRGELEKAPSFADIGRAITKAGLASAIEPATLYIMSMLASDEDREAMAGETKKNAEE